MPLKKSKVFILCVTAILLSITTAHAARTVNYNGPVTVNVAVLNATEVDFPEEIASVVMGLPNDKISLEHSKNMIFLQPLMADVEGEIYVIGKSGRSYIISINVVDKTLRDKHLKIVPTDQMQIERVEQLKGLTPLGLIKAMALGQDLDGVFIENKSVVLFEDKNLKIVAESKYDAVSMKGYIVTLHNFAQVPFDFRTLNIKGLVAFSYYKDKGYVVIYE